VIKELKEFKDFRVVKFQQELEDLRILMSIASNLNYFAYYRFIFWILNSKKYPKIYKKVPMFLRSLGVNKKNS
jgi:hypothetical protein